MFSYTCAIDSSNLSIGKLIKSFSYAYIVHIMLCLKGTDDIVFNVAHNLFTTVSMYDICLTILSAWTMYRQHNYLFAMDLLL